MCLFFVIWNSLCGAKEFVAVLALFGLDPLHYLSARSLYMRRYVIATLRSLSNLVRAQKVTHQLYKIHTLGNFC